MPKKLSKATVEEEVVTPEEEVETESEVVEPQEEATVDAKSVKKADVVVGNGKFQAVEVKGGYTLYNPDGVAVSRVIPESEAKDMANRHNASMHLK